MLYEPQDARTEEGRKEAYWSRWRPYTQAMREAGVLAACPGNVIQPAGTACTVTAAASACPAASRNVKQLVAPQL